MSNLANAANAILMYAILCHGNTLLTFIFRRPPIGYSRKPVIFLPRIPISEDNKESQSMHEDDLDRHVEEVLSRRAKIRRTLQGVWAFLKTRECLSGHCHVNSSDKLVAMGVSICSSREKTFNNGYA